MNYARFLKGDRDFAVLFTPGPRTSLDSTSATKNHLIVNELDNVRNRLYTLTLRADGGWQRTPLAAPAFGSVSATAVDRDESDDFFLTVTDFLTPSTLAYGTIGRDERTTLKQLPGFFKTDGLEITQHEAASKDGTRVPYFQVARADLKLDGSHPTLLYGYGGFEVSLTPTYSGCPAMREMEADGKAALLARGVPQVEVRTVLTPAWTTDWIGPEAREKLRKYGIAPPGRAEPQGFVTLTRARPAVACPFCGSNDTVLQSEFGSTACKAIHTCKACGSPFDEFKAL
jgi:phenylacetate-CoA oxygenase PaaJ subunit